MDAARQPQYQRQSSSAQAQRSTRESHACSYTSTHIERIILIVMSGLFIGCAPPEEKCVYGCASESSTELDTAGEGDETSGATGIDPNVDWGGEPGHPDRDLPASDTTWCWTTNGTRDGLALLVVGLPSGTFYEYARFGTWDYQDSVTAFGLTYDGTDVVSYTLPLRDEYESWYRLDTRALTMEWGSKRIPTGSSFTWDGTSYWLEEESSSFRIKAYQTWSDLNAGISSATLDTRDWPISGGWELQHGNGRLYMARTNDVAVHDWPSGELLYETSLPEAWGAKGLAHANGMLMSSCQLLGRSRRAGARPRIGRFDPRQRPDRLHRTGLGRGSSHRTNPCRGPSGWARTEG